MMKNTFPPKAPLSPSPGRGQPEGVWLGQRWLCSVCKWASLTNVNIHKAKLPWGLQGWTAWPPVQLPRMQEVWGDSGLSCPANKERLSRALSHLFTVRSQNPSQWGGMTLYAREFVAPGTAPDRSEGSSYGKHFLCIPWRAFSLSAFSLPDKHIVDVFLLPLANHALKHVRGACTTFSSSM